MNPKNNSSLQLMLTEYFQAGGVITKCKPRLAPKRRASSGKIFTLDQAKIELGIRQIKRIA